MLPIERLNLLEKLFIPTSVLSTEKVSSLNKLSIDTLLDSLVALYDDCCNSTLRREKIISNFIDYGKLCYFG